MPVSKKLRFEVFKRDNFKCQYCGKSPPEIILEADHLTPKSKKGKDEINNLVTSCFDCNRGKSNIEIEKLPESIKENYEILQEKELQLKEYQKLIAKIEKRVNEEIEKVNSVYEEYFPDMTLSDNFKRTSLRKFLSLLPVNEVVQAMHIACTKLYHQDRSIRYFCGICWQEIRGTGIG